MEWSSDFICVLDGTGTITYTSPAGARLLGYASGSNAGRDVTEFLDHDDLPAVAAALQHLVDDPSAVVTVATRLRTASGVWVAVEARATNRLDDPDVQGIIVNVRDVSERVEAADRLAWQAFHDPLTGLPNRALLLDQVGRLGEHPVTGHTALLFLDVDRFKVVNDSFGHQAGDRLLVEVAARLRSAVRPDDVVFRLGGDEFVILARGLGARDDAERLAGRVSRALDDPIRVEGSEVGVTVSIGIAFADGGAGVVPGALLRDADIAMYRAKQLGKDRWEVFDASLRAEAVARMATEQELRRVVDDGSLEVHFQPVVDLRDGSVVAAEALLRIPRGDGTFHPAAPFVAVAEETGLIVPVGGVVLAVAAHELARWRDRDVGAGTSVGAVSVNVAARQLASPGFAHMVERTLEHNGLRPGDLVLELTETTVIGADRASVRSVERLHGLGVRFVIDDFGTGYSSLTYLKRFPLSGVKVDRSFVVGLGDPDGGDAEIVAAVLSLSRSLGLSVVAEGIETPAQLAALQRLGCVFGQGYLFGRPGPADQLPGHAQRGRFTG